MAYSASLTGLIEIINSFLEVLGCGQHEVLVCLDLHILLQTSFAVAMGPRFRTILVTIKRTLGKDWLVEGHEKLLAGLQEP